MLRVTELKEGKFILLGSVPYEVLEYTHSKLGRGGAIVKTKLKDLKSGTIIDRIFKGQEKIEEASLTTLPSQYLWSDGSSSYFMDSGTFNQYSLSEEKIGSKKDFLKEGLEIEVLFSGKEPISIRVPIKVKYKVKSAEPGVKGDTAGAATKEATIETGFKIQVPLFIKEGDTIIVDTRTGKYVERA